MKNYSDLEYLKLSKWDKFLYGILSFLISIPRGIWNFICSVGKGIANLFRAIGREFADLGTTFAKGSFATKLSYLIMGFGNGLGGFGRYAGFCKPCIKAK